MLLLSELVTNAVLHSTGPLDAPILLAALCRDDTVSVSVTDAGQGFTPEPHKRVTVGGLGLHLLEREASRWGIDRIGGTRVWFEL